MRCAAWARSAQVDPVGTAGSARGWLLVDWPLPWPRAVDAVRRLEPVTSALAGTGVRLQLVAPDDTAGPRRRVVLHRVRGTDGWFEGCERHALDVDADDVVDAAIALVSGEERRPSPGIDLLVCTHGSRDRCCGSLGTSLSLRPGPGVRVLRTSHLGGHRFAPTGMLLPDATAWAFLDPDAVQRIVTRSGPLDDLLPRYRGCAALGLPAAQAIDRAAAREVGWAWFDHPRRAVEGREGRVVLEARAPSGGTLVWDAEVMAGRNLPVPDCGDDPAAARKFETEVVLHDVRRVHGDPALPAERVPGED